MLFNSFDFAIFFAIVYCLYWAMGRKYHAQNALLLVSSFLFYGWWDVRFLYLFVLTTVVDFVCALMIARGEVGRWQRLIVSLVLMGAAFLCVTVQWHAANFPLALVHPRLIDWPTFLPHDRFPWLVLFGTATAVAAGNLLYPWLKCLGEERRRRVFIASSVISNLGVLAIFKYFNFFAETFASAVHAAFNVTPSAWTLHLVLPVGISFYTFQSLAYTIDVYRGQIAPVRRYTVLATFLSFFPQLVAGPIERARHVLPQFTRPRTTSLEQFREGAWLIAWGLFKKMVVADNMATIVNQIFGPYDGHHPSHLVPHDGLRMLLGIYAFAMQIYGDFSGYTDIARGVARLLGFELMLNFKLPYFAITPSDFWARWHISLSTWLRDYLYIPLGGNRRGTLKTYRNLFLTMVLGGLWHGANWTFVLWGAFHGVILIIYRVFAPNLDSNLKKTPKPDEAVSRAPRTPVVATYSTLGFLPAPLLDGVVIARFGQGLKRAILMLIMFHLTCIGWLLFRAQSMTAVSVFLRSIVFHPHLSPETIALARDFVFYGWFLIVFQFVQAYMGTLDPVRRFPWFIRLNIWIFIIMALFALTSGEAKSFIYFAF